MVRNVHVNNHFMKTVNVNTVSYCTLHAQQIISCACTLWQSRQYMYILYMYKAQTLYQATYCVCSVQHLQKYGLLYTYMYICYTINNSLRIHISINNTNLLIDGGSNKYPG